MTANSVLIKHLAICIDLFGIVSSPFAFFAVIPVMIDSTHEGVTCWNSSLGGFCGMSSPSLYRFTHFAEYL